MNEKRPTVLIVDDEPVNISVLMDLLKEEYRLVAARNGRQALERVEGSPPDLILLDIMMPEMDGYEVCRRLKEDPHSRHIPVIFISAMSADEDETRGLELGAVDYITKPISPAIVTARVRTHLSLKQARQELAEQNLILEEKVRERTAELATTQDVTILAMASLAETRDNETGNHIRRTQHYIKVLAEELANRPPYDEQLPPEIIDLLYKSAPLHDIGKVGIPDHVLLKPGKLTDEEFMIMKGHPGLGLHAITTAEKLLGDRDTSFLRHARDIAYTHHEKWDGSGYPQRLKGEEIPLPGRLMAVADVYDALITKRVYKDAFSHEKAVEIIREGSGSHFDPAVVEAFERVVEGFREVAERFSD